MNNKGTLFSLHFLFDDYFWSQDYPYSNLTFMVLGQTISQLETIRKKYSETV